MTRLTLGLFRFSTRAARSVRNLISRFAPAPENLPGLIIGAHAFHALHHSAVFAAFGADAYRNVIFHDNASKSVRIDMSFDVKKIWRQLMVFRHSPFPFHHWRARSLQAQCNDKRRFATKVAELGKYFSV
ncbi:hypothetical protein [Hyphococcus sp.]|uniref:hypothetical protein n=1 Tax=Hyphococcus sp. TaxID=2038636 RepID=UPI003CCC3AD6